MSALSQKGHSGRPQSVVIGIWQLVGLNMILFLAGLSAIHRELYDVAALDGADAPFDRFVRLTWPQLGPTTLLATVASGVMAFKVFETVAALTQGRQGSEVLLYTIYREGFQYFRLGYASALTLVFLAFLAFLLLWFALQFKHLARKASCG